MASPPRAALRLPAVPRASWTGRVLDWRGALYAILRHMKRTTIFLDEGLERDVKALAERQGCSTASVVREALAAYVTEQRESGSDLSFVAAGNSGSNDVAERHEEILFGDLEPHEPEEIGTDRDQGR